MHLTTRINDQNLDMEGYTFKRCNHPNDIARGGIGVYYKSTLAIMLKPELTKLTITLISQVNIGTEKCFFTCIYRIPSADNNSAIIVNEFRSELSKTLDNIKGKNPYINFVIDDLNAKNSSWWGDVSDYPGGIK